MSLPEQELVEALARIEELEAEVAQLDRAYDMAHARLLELKGENAKLREALEKITRTYGSAGAIAIARAALEVSDG